MYRTAKQFDANKKLYVKFIHIFIKQVNFLISGFAILSDLNMNEFNKICFKQ